ncbi:MAG TPA: ABC transporter substrate-binding protein [Solirubrobacteraceae bacterium]|nr:ABC transporter substrate-binding protein [Solirubrobacteraceae bacterium]
MFFRVPAREARRRARTVLMLGAVAAVCALAVAGHSGPGGSTAKLGLTAQDSVNVGVASTLSGTFASLGVPGLDGIKLAVNQINSKGGLLGAHLNLVKADDQIDPATGATVTRQLILNDHVKVLFGSVSSAVAEAQEQLAAEYKVPIFFHIANDIGLTTTHYTKYAYEISPNTDMEPAAAALAFARVIGKGHHVRIATITPNYSFGLDTVKAFLSDLKKDGVSYTVTDQQTPALGASSFTSSISALLSTNPQYVFSGQYGSDLVTLTKQGIGLGLFKKARVGAMYDYDVLHALGKQAPAGVIAWDRAAFWTIHSSAMNAFVAAYKKAYGSYPDEWAINGYDAVQIWAAGVRKAGSFDPDKLSQALAGATVSTPRGDITIRACDHQAEVVEDTGIVSGKMNARYGTALWSQTFTPTVNQIIDGCSAH